ncbi:hypothetical protein EJB05_36937, partial [Eragrostis curvula]
MLPWILDPASRDATILKQALTGDVTDLRAATEVISSRTPSQLQILRQTYRARFGCYVEHDVTERTSGDHQRLLLSYLAIPRYEGPEADPSLASIDARELYKAGERRLGTDEDVYRRYDRGYTVSVGDDLASTLSVLVFALREADNGGVPQWVKRNGRSLADRVLFLGPVSSFAVDAASIGMSSGCAYFVQRIGSFCVSDGIGRKKYHPEQSRVFNNAKSEFVEELPLRWNREPFMWVSPRPAIATKQEIRSRAANFRIYVGNLPQNVDCNRLRQFFSNHGKVADVRIMYNRKTKRSQGFGFVTMMPAKDDEPADIIAKLHGESLDGRPLQVELAN